MRNFQHIRIEKLVAYRNDTIPIYYIDFHRMEKFVTTSLNLGEQSAHQI